MSRLIEKIKKICLDIYLKTIYNLNEKRTMK